MVVWVWHTTVASYNCVLPRHCAQPRTGSLRRLATHATTAQRPAKTRFVLAAAPSRLSQHPKPPVGPAKPDTRSSRQPCRRAAAPRLASFQRATLKLHPQSAPSTQPRQAKHRAHAWPQPPVTNNRDTGSQTRQVHALPRPANHAVAAAAAPRPRACVAGLALWLWRCGAHVCMCVCVCVCVCVLPIIF